jgi:UDP-glucose 4-epimerase
MNILLTGGAGYIGSHAAVVLTEAGHQVVILDNFCNSHRGVLDRLAKLLGKTLTCIDGDIRDTDLVQKALQDFKIDAVMHFAGLKAVGESVQKPIEYFDNNVSGTISLLKAMQKANVKTLVFSSSATVYGDPQYLPLDEAHPTSSNNPYGRNKLHIEEMLSDVVAADQSWRVILLRYFNPVGAHESGLIGEDPNGIPNNLVPYVAKVAAGELPCLSVFGNDYGTPDGTGVRDYIHVMDLVEGHLAALDYIGQHSGYHVVNLGTGIGTSVLEMVKAYELASFQKIIYRVLVRRPGDVASCYAKVDKANSMLGWKAKRSIIDMCASSWHWQENRRKFS